MKETLQLRVKPEIAYTPLRLQAEVSTRLGVDVNRIKDVVITRRSIDARQRQVMVNLSVDAYIDEVPPRRTLMKPIVYPSVKDSPQQAVVVGAGPAGLFAALKLIQLGVRPIVVERGKSVEQRAADMAQISRSGTVDPESNYCFGEGGAGAYSDGKLYTRSKKRGSVEDILNTFAFHGASPDILVDAHPHIGTDRLPQVIRAMRQSILDAGGEVRFSTRMDRLVIDEDKDEVKGIVTSEGETIHGPVILATGHSARDVYRMLVAEGVEVEAKGIAVGVRLEHPQQLIDQIQYHNPNGRGKYLPAAEYSMLTRVEDRGVYSFCMCPGGVIIPAATAPGQLVVNGMSPAARAGRWANSGMVVEVLPDDLPELPGLPSELKVMAFQEQIEKAFYNDANPDASVAPTHNAPAQRMTDFVASRASKDLPATSYAPGIHPARIDWLLPGFVARRLQEGMKEFGRKQRGFLSPEATLIGAETRTSSPVRVVRQPDTLRHTRLSGLYPCGEGAGYAGGIVSAAIDGQRCAEALAGDYSR